MSASLLERIVKSKGPDSLFSSLTASQRERLRFTWEAMARPEQLPPPEPWRYWVILAGRGFGKTRTGAETVRKWSKRYSHVNLIGATVDDARDIMIDGESGILAVCPTDERPRYVKSERRLDWPNGCKSLVFTADEPERLRGKQHEKLWADELAAWRYEESWTQALLGLRLGDNPQAVVTTTPRPTQFLKLLLKNRSTVITRGSTLDNKANLATQFVEEIVSQYEGTRIGRQEIYAEMLEDVEGALWRAGMIDDHRVNELPDGLRRIVVAADPSGSAKRTADIAGISVAGIGDCRCKGRVETHVFVLQDKSGRMSPRDMGERSIDAYRSWRADRLVAEDNFGGKIIEDLIQLIDPTVSYRAVRATRGKIIRAEPVAALYEQGKVHHVGVHRELEAEMCSYAPLISTESPGRLDALVWAITDLMLGETNADADNKNWKSSEFTLGGNAPVDDWDD